MSSIRSNRFFNNPGIGAAFENIASMFAPPSAQDTYAYAKARAEREDAARKQQVYDYANDPNYDSSVADRKAAAAGVYLPIQSFYAVDQSNATTRRGQDIGSADERYKADATSAAARYGHDRSYQASVENGKLSELGKFFVPLNEGQNRPAVPSVIAQQYGFDGDIPQAEGRQKPLNESEWRAARADQMWREGGLSNNQLVDLINGQETPVKAVGPEGRPVFMTPGTAVRTGAQPYEAPTAASKPELQNWIGPNGSGGGTAIYDAASGQWQDTTTRQPLPAGSRTYTGQLQGGADATGLGPTTSNATEATRLESSLDQAQTLVGGIRSILNENKNVAGVPGRLKGVVQSLTSSAQQVAAAYAADAPEAALSIDEARNLIGTKFGASMRGYDPSIVRVQSMLFDLAYARAQMANSSGEVSRQGFERALESLGQGVLSSQTDLETALDAFERDTIGAGRVKVDTLRGRRPGAAPSAGPSPASATAAPGGATRLRFDANGDPIR